MVEFGADGVGVGVVNVGEDGEGVLPGDAGAVGVAEVGADEGLVVAVAQVPVQVVGLPAVGESHEQSLVAANRAESTGLPDLATGGLV